MELVFYISAAVAIAATLCVVTHADPVHALLYLTVSLLAVALIFIILGAPFIGALEVILYAGAIMVLFIFVVIFWVFSFLMALSVSIRDKVRKS